MKALACAAAIFSAAFSHQVLAADEAKDLIDLCRKYQAYPKAEFTQDLIRLRSSCAGVLNAHIRVSRPDSGYCRPKEINMEELTRIYLSWADRNLDRWKDPRAVTVDAAFAEVYPCPK